MNKTIIAVALAGAFSISANAADITIGGKQEWSYQDNDGATSTKLDGEVNFRATSELDNGMSVSADINITEDAKNEGDARLLLKGNFGQLYLGDVKSATDNIDDVSDWGYELTDGTSSSDHAVLYTLPNVINGLNIHVSHAADSNQDDNAAGDAYAVEYQVAMVGVGYGQKNNDDDSEETLYNATVDFKGVGLAYEVKTDTTALDVDTDTTAIGATYTLNDIMIGYENLDTESEGTVSSDITTYGIHYKVASELTLFAERSEDDLDQTSKTTAVGIAYKF